MAWNWKQVEKDGLPEPDRNKDYFVLFPSGCGYGTYDWVREDRGYKEILLPNGEVFKTKNYVDTDRARWYVDYDGVGYEEEIHSYVEIEYPDWTRSENDLDI